MAKLLKKSDIQEIIDGNDNIIGKFDQPDVSPDNETQANRTTDYNANVSHQNFKNDFLGRFGFYFYESEGDNEKVLDSLAKLMYEKYLEVLTHYIENPGKLEKDYEIHSKTDFGSQPNDSKEHDYEWAADILNLLKPHLKEKLNESKVVEDKIVTKKKDKLNKKKEDNELTNSKLEKVSDLLSKLKKDDLDKLINLLESKKSKKNFEVVNKPSDLKSKMKDVSLGKDKNGYFVYTHRARSKSYESPEKIPDSKIKFIKSTG